jgi:DNA-binding response OmpR family regulator
MKLKVLALGNEETTSFIANSLVGRGIEVVRLYEFPESVNVLKQEKFDLVVVESNIADLDGICFRVIWVCRVRVAVITSTPQNDWHNLQVIGVDAFINRDTGPAELAADIEAIANRGAPQFDPIAILVIEDDKYIREAISLCFRIYWPEAVVHFAENGQTGVSLAKSKSPDIILVDLGLPDISGFDTLNYIRPFCQVPIIVLSADRNPEHVARALQSGANDYVIKPFKQAELMSRIKKQVSHVTQKETQPTSM